VLDVLDRLPKRDNDKGQRIMQKLSEIGETARARDWAGAIVGKDHRMDRHAVPEALKVLLLDTDPLALAEEISQSAEQEKSTSRTVTAAELAMELGAYERAAALVRKFFTGSGHGFGDEAGKMARLLIQCEGIKRSEEVLIFLRKISEPWRSERVVIGAASQLSLAGALPAATSLWQELLADPSVSIVASFRACSAIVQSGQRDLALTALRAALGQESISASDRARLSALLSWTLARDPNVSLTALPS
jgi:thioredoxin-like negative regulator of GroEL